MYVKLLSKDLRVFKYLFLVLFLQTFFIPPLEAKEMRIEKVVTGKVTDESGEGIPGANIRIKETTIGTVTDIDGNYAITVRSEEHTSELQSRENLVCRLLHENKNSNFTTNDY